MSVSTAEPLPADVADEGPGSGSSDLGGRSARKSPSRLAIRDAEGHPAAAPTAGYEPEPGQHCRSARKRPAPRAMRPCVPIGASGGASSARPMKLRPVMQPVGRAAQADAYSAMSSALLLDHRNLLLSDGDGSALPACSDEPATVCSPGRSVRCRGRHSNPEKEKRSSETAPTCLV
jgi:hypothetical protein